MPTRDIIVIGASAGGLEALTQVVRGLPPGFPAAVFVVCHFPAAGSSRLPEILSRRGPLLAHHARDGEPVLPGQIYVAPPDFHLLLRPGSVQLTHDPRENRHRPAIDPLFRSAARAYGPRVIGVVLSGALSDGTAGLLAVRAAGGLAVVQDPRDALAPGMPASARTVAGADHVATAAALAPLLTDLVRQPAPEARTMTEDPQDRLKQTMAQDMDAQQHGGRRGEVSIFTCPECGGALWQVDETGLTRFNCHVGHAYYGETLLDEQSEVLEAALWTAVRTFREKTILARQLAEQERARGHAAAAERFTEQADQADQYGTMIQQFILNLAGPPGGTPSGPPGDGPGTPAPPDPSEAAGG